MIDPNFDMTMAMLRGAGQNLIDANIALKIAKMVFERQIGTEVTRLQIPFAITEQGDRWEILGTNITPSSRDLSDPVGGQLRMVIMKFDGQIVHLSRLMISG